MHLKNIVVVWTISNVQPNRLEAVGPKESSTYSFHVSRLKSDIHMARITIPAGKAKRACLTSRYPTYNLVMRSEKPSVATYAGIFIENDKPEREEAHKEGAL